MLSSTCWNSGWQHRFVCWLLSCFLIVMSSAAANGNSNNITFIFMVSSPTQNSTLVLQDTTGVRPAVQMAMEAINNRTDLLPNYYLTYGETVLNSQCDRRTSLTEFYSQVTNPPHKTFLLGCGCSVATEATSEISNFWNILDMSYGSQSPALSSRYNYPNFFRTVPSSLGVVNVIIGLMNTYGWRKLYIIDQFEEPEFGTVTETLKTYPNLNTSTFYFLSSQNISEIFSFNQSSMDQYRIYFLNMYPVHARRILCAAYHYPGPRSLSYPNYIWLVLGWYPQNWWKLSMAGNDSCSDQQIETMLERSLTISHYPYMQPNDNTITDVGMTTSQFYTEYNNRLSIGTPQTYAAPFAYDALWSVAFAINSSLSSVNLSMLDYGDVSRQTTAAIAQNLIKSNFTGITGEVSFDVNGTRVQTSPRVSQYRNQSGTLTLVLIGDILTIQSSNSSNSRYIMEYTGSESNDSVWPIIIPYDGSPLAQTDPILLYVFIPIYVFSISTIVFAVICALVNFILRKRKIIRLTSPNLNYLIILGCILFCISALLYTYRTTCYTTVFVLCYVRAFTQLLGYTLCFGTICAKLWRVYYIFHNPTPNKRKAIKDVYLFLMVFAVFAFDIVYMSIALGADTEYVPQEVPDREIVSMENEYGIIIMINNLVCNSPRSIIWIAVIFFLKFLIQVVAVFFALKTRKVKIKALNDARWISMITYITSVILLILLISAQALEDFLNADAAVYSTCLILVSNVVLVILFTPKWYSLYKDPKGENLYEYESQHMSNMTQDQEAVMGQMTSHIEQLEKRLGKYEAVTPFQTRKRVLSSGSGLAITSNNNPRMASLRINSGIRSGSFSPAPMDVTASLPAGRFALTPLTPTSPNSPKNAESPNNSGDSGINGQSPDDKNKNGMLSVKEEDPLNMSQSFDDERTISAKVLTFKDEIVSTRL